MRRTPLLCLFLLVFATLYGCAQLQPKDPATPSHQQAEQELPASHPSNYYVYATRLFHEGAKEDAVFWFYVGEIRYRFYLAANPNLPPDGDPALFASLHESAGSVINGWAGADPDSWVKQMGRALDWDAANDNKFTSKITYAKQWQQTRSGLENLKEWVVANKTQILEERKKRGL
ncbi:hypothetical protein IHE49_02920 [Rhodanobacter sp. 7MK24]|uniref:hypothetical protein n=1 Tax=Rhodanobacter sp. 7MK24 TaxID=2775922 RepID=UPI00177B05C4|nr:hypothetical protein [Rhodanobacter sp. 7MK24]MBD8879428.1 hypothetical protein [Rhodanobacter sp. 7MK24]